MSDLNTIATKIRDNAIKAFAQVSVVDGDRAKAREDAKGAVNTAYGKREEIFRALSGAAVKGKWANHDIDAGIAAALASSNVDGDSMKTFAGELAKVCNERVRDHVATIFDVSTKLWNAEKAALEADKDADAPLTTAFARSIQVAHALMSAALGKKDKKGNWKIVPVIVTAETDVIAFCEARDPAKDAKKIAAKLKRLRETFDEFHVEFPHPVFATIDGALAKLTVEALQGAAGTIKQPVQTAPGKAIKAERAKTNGAAPLEGASDVIDGMNGIDFQA